jgi:hypothetical protein
MTAWFLIQFVQQRASIPTIIRGVSRLIIAQPPRYVWLMHLHASPQKPVIGALTGGSSHPSTPRYHNGKRGFPTEILWMWCLLTQHFVRVALHNPGILMLFQKCRPLAGGSGPWSACTCASAAILPTERTAMVSRCLPQTPGMTTQAPFRAATGWLVPGKQIYTCTEYPRHPQPLATSVIWDYADNRKEGKVIAYTVHPR